MWGWRRATWGGGTRERARSRETYQARKGRWRGTLFEPVPRTKLCEFLDTKKEVSAVGSKPIKTLAMSCYRRFVAADNNGLRGLCDSWCLVQGKSGL